MVNLRPRGRSTLDISTGLSMRDLLREAASGMVAKPGRSILTALGTVLGVGALVVILGLTSTASSRVSARFDAQAATTVRVDDNRAIGSTSRFPFTAQALRHARLLNGVLDAALIFSPATADTVRSANPERDDDQNIPILAVSSSTWATVGATFSAGGGFGEFQEDKPVVVLGRGAATLLGVTGNGPPTAVQIGSRPFMVAGVLDDVDRRADLLLAAMVPAGTATALWGEPTVKVGAQVIIATRPGAALQVAGEAGLAMSYLAPDDVSVTAPPDPRLLRESVSGDLRGLFFALAGISLLIGTVGIASTTLVAVMERSSEIGLRRALGARGRHIAAQVVAESAGLGILGGIVGSSIGLLSIVAISLARDWSPVVNPWHLVWAPLVGLVTGAVAGMYPAVRAIRIEPSQALRGIGS
jgi:putative ABC transport system permease protein